jgi:hypothetical protein
MERLQAKLGRNTCSYSSIVVSFYFVYARGSTADPLAHVLLQLQACRLQVRIVAHLLLFNSATRNLGPLY